MGAGMPATMENQNSVVSILTPPDTKENVVEQNVCGIGGTGSSLGNHSLCSGSVIPALRNLKGWDFHGLDKLFQGHFWPLPYEIDAYLSHKKYLMSS